ncbi:metal ABC transporter substrate-binding protein [Desulfatirhabdium butyrativorans]|uniref:metal ABC transporter substrate-binding protein n=1 Tax=Desulfatirhabdium butyrativorans TaxID=340467 RepID=UPI000A0717DD|nr:metal ABC transporter substrate-binding protein [Desulfatirhabdium butyrativorans]
MKSPSIHRDRACPNLPGVENYCGLRRFARVLGKCIALVLAMMLLPAMSRAETAVRKILCTTYPLHLITRNITEGRADVIVERLLPSQLGCPHDYVLTPQDMKRLEKADVLIINGLGLEEFLSIPLKKINPNLKVIDSSKGISDLLPDTEAHDHHHAEGKKGPSAANDPQHEFNPHLFASPKEAARIAATIASSLSAIDPEGAEVYSRNARAYGERLDGLARDLAGAVSGLRNNRIITQHGVFDYLARDSGLEIVGVIQAHAGKDPSAAEMIALVKTARSTGAGAVFAEPQYPQRIARTIAKEAGIAFAVLDPVASGPENPPLAYYETVMRGNIETLKKTLPPKP